MTLKLEKITAHLACWLPLGYLVFGAVNRDLGADPQEQVMHLLGFWGLLFLLLSLSITPMRRLLRMPWVFQFRRMLGLYAAFYLLLHIATFTIFYLNFNVYELWNETLKRPYISVGMLAFILLIPLVATSTKSMQRRLGKKWVKLHRLVYLIACLGVIHFVWQTKADLNEPLSYALILVFLIGIRLYWFLASKKRSGKARQSFRS